MLILFSDILAMSYPYVKSIHIMAVMSWMAGLFYLPRLFVYHAEQSNVGDSRDEVFRVMEYKLFKVIMNPAMIVTWICGIFLALTPGIVDWSNFWPWTKVLGICGMTWFHHYLGYRIKDFAAGTNTRSGRDYRIMNEVPTVLMIVIVLSVVVKF